MLDEPITIIEEKFESPMIIPRYDIPESTTNPVSLQVTNVQLIFILSTSLSFVDSHGLNVNNH